jgi:hypothetical protein
MGAVTPQSDRIRNAFIDGNERLPLTSGLRSASKKTVSLNIEFPLLQRLQSIVQLIFIGFCGQKNNFFRRAPRNPGMVSEFYEFDHSEQ